MDVHELACRTVEYIQTGPASEQFAIEERLILHRAYAKADKRQLVRLFTTQLAYFCALQGKTRKQMVQIAMKLVNYYGDDLLSILRTRLMDLISEDFRDCRNAFNLNSSPAFLAQLTARSIKAICESVQIWAESSDNHIVYDHIRRMLHENADRLNPHQRRQAIIDVEKWFSDSLKESAANESSLAPSVWDRIICFAGYRTSMMTIRCLNRRLFFTCHKPKSWKHIRELEIDLLWIPSTQEDIALLFQRTPSLLSLRCTRDPGRLTAEVISAVAKSCQYLEDVFFEGWSCLTDDHVKSLAMSCSRLKRITLDSCRLLTDKALAFIAADCPEIEHLSLNWCPKITLLPILNSGVLKGLKSLSVANANDREPDILSEAAFSRLLRLYDNLDRLVFSGRTQLDDRGFSTLSISNLIHLDCSDITGVTDKWVLQISNVCPNLRFVNFSKCPLKRIDAAESGLANLNQLLLVNCNALVNDALHNLVNCQNLSVMDLSGCTFLSDSAFTKLPRDWRSIRVLSLDRCAALTDRSVSAICRRMRLIESLSLQDLYHLSNRSLKAIASDLQNLVHLNVSGCNKMSDDGISCLESFRNSMQSLNISNLTSITAISMQCLVSFKALESFNISGCSSIDTEGILILCASAFRSSILALSIAKCSGIEDDTMKLIGICFPVLRELDVSSCINVSDLGIVTLISESSSIRSLNVSECVKMTEAGIRRVLSNAPKLRFIDISGCSQISPHYISSLRQEYPGINFVDNPTDLLLQSMSLKLEQTRRSFHLDRAVTL